MNQAGHFVNHKPKLHPKSLARRTILNQSAVRSSSLQPLKYVNIVKNLTLLHNNTSIINNIVLTNEIVSTFI